MTPHSSPLTPYIAVIGAGYWGKNLVRNFHQLGALKTICDPSSTIRQQMAKNYPDTPVKRYSSGMYVRLAFAVAAYLEPEILVVDEVLAGN